MADLVCFGSRGHQEYILRPVLPRHLLRRRRWWGRRSGAAPPHEASPTYRTVRRTCGEAASCSAVVPRQGRALAARVRQIRQDEAGRRERHPGVVCGTEYQHTSRERVLLRRSDGEYGTLPG